jgi:hypothetical protein
VARISITLFSKAVGIGSREHDLVGHSLTISITGINICTRNRRKIKKTIFISNRR